MKAFDLTWMLLKQGRVGPIDHDKSPFPMGQTAMQDKYDIRTLFDKLMRGEELTPEELRVMQGFGDDYGPMITDIDQDYYDDFYNNDVPYDELSEEEKREIDEIYEEYERAYGED